MTNQSKKSDDDTESTLETDEGRTLGTGGFESGPKTEAVQTDDMESDGMKTDQAVASQELIATAYHESGHALMALIVGRPVLKVTIITANMTGGGVRLGACKMQKGRTKPSKDWLEDDVLILFAGMVAESQVTGQYCERGARLDLQSIRRLLSHSRASNERQLEKLERRLLDKTEYLLADEANAKALELIATELIEKRTISGRTVTHHFNQTR